MQKGSPSGPPPVLPTTKPLAEPTPSSPWLQPLRTPRLHRLLSRTILLFVSLYALYLYATLPPGPRKSVLVAQPEPDHEALDPHQTLGWAQYRPYTPVEAYRPPPEECSVIQVHILQRHGARYPTSSAAEDILAALDKLRAAQNHTGPLAFLDEYTYDLGEDDLVPLGAAESYSAGALVYERYAHLFVDGEPEGVPFVRASSGQRVVDSATNWTAGFSWASGQEVPPLAVVLSEAGNDTLDDKNCPAAKLHPSSAESTWLHTALPPLTARLAALSSPTPNLTVEDTHALMSLCALDSVAHGAPSVWCSLFDELAADWAAFAYAADLEKYFGTGYGAPLGRVQGVGFALELLARLVGAPLDLAGGGGLNVNRTLDDARATFPLRRRAYVDFSHDNAMVAIFAALRLFRPARPLNDTAREDGPWAVERMVPFGGRAVVEKLECVRDGEVPKLYVRVLVNDAVQTSEGCAAGEGAWAGVCRLQEWMESLQYVRARGAGDWGRCFEPEA